MVGPITTVNPLLKALIAAINGGSNGLGNNLDAAATYLLFITTNLFIPQLDTAFSLL